MLPPGAIFYLKIHQNVFATGASPRTAVKLYSSYYSALPGPYLVFRSRFAAGGERRKVEGKGRERREASPHF